MTNFFSTLIIISFNLVILGQENDLADLHFKGKVKSVDVTIYKESPSGKETATVISTHKVFYNVYGNTAVEIYPERSVSYHYSENGLLISTKVSGENGTFYYKYIYDESRNLDKRLKCNDSLQQDCHLFQQFKSDKNGNKLQETGFDDEGKQVITYYYKYDSDNRKTEDGQLNDLGDTIHKMTYFYNKLGQPSKIRGKYSSTDFEYNNFGDQVKLINYVLGGKKTGQTINQYKYDVQGNWINLISTEAHFSRESDYVLRIVRKIEYY